MSHFIFITTTTSFHLFSKSHNKWQRDLSQMAVQRPNATLGGCTAIFSAVLETAEKMVAAWPVCFHAMCWVSITDTGSKMPWDIWFHDGRANGSVSSCQLYCWQPCTSSGAMLQAKRERSVRYLLTSPHICVITTSPAQRLPGRNVCAICDQYGAQNWEYVDLKLHGQVYGPKGPIS